MTKAGSKFSIATWVKKHPLHVFLKRTQPDNQEHHATFMFFIFSLLYDDRFNKIQKSFNYQCIKLNIIIVMIA